MTKTKIEWSEEVWNFVTGCTRVSDGCTHCYIDRTPPFRMTDRAFDGPHIGATTGVVTHPDRLDKPLYWRSPRRVFVNSLSDVFHAEVPEAVIAHAFAVMALTGRHTYQILTKRPPRMRHLMGSRHFREAVAEHATALIGDRPWRPLDRHRHTTRRQPMGTAMASTEHPPRRVRGASARREPPHPRTGGHGRRGAVPVLRTA